MVKLKGAGVILHMSVKLEAIAPAIGGKWDFILAWRATQSIIQRQYHVTQAPHHDDDAHGEDAAADHGHDHPRGRLLLRFPHGEPHPGGGLGSGQLGVQPGPLQRMQHRASCVHLLWWRFDMSINKHNSLRAIVDRGHEQWRHAHEHILLHGL